MQRRRVPGGLPAQRLEPLVDVHAVVRYWFAAPLAHRRPSPAFRRCPLPTPSRDAALQCYAVPDPLPRERFQRLEHVHQVVRHWLAVALALDPHLPPPRRLCVPVSCRDPLVQLARVPEGLPGRPLERLDHVHEVVCWWIPAPYTHQHAAALRWPRVPAHR